MVVQLAHQSKMLRNPGMRCEENVDGTCISHQLDEVIRLCISRKALHGKAEIKWCVCFVAQRCFTVLLTIVQLQLRAVCSYSEGRCRGT